MEETEEQIKNSKPWLFQKGQSGNPGGRPKGSVSPITELKRIFAEEPEEFKAFVKRYKDNPANEKHVVEMLDDKPRQRTDITSNGKTLNQLTQVPDDELNDLAYGSKE